MKLTDEDGKEYEFRGNLWNCAYVKGTLTPIKPKLKKIDMSAVITSGIDCEFWDEDDTPYISCLRSIHDKSYRFRSNVDDNTYCRPRMNGHIHASPTGWDKCPLPEGFMVKLWGRKSTTPWTGEDSCASWNWEHIAMFEITGIAEGYEL